MSFICMRKTSFLSQWLRTLPRFETEAWGISKMAYFEYLCLTCHLSFSRWRPMMAITHPCRKDIPKWSAMVTRQDLFSAYPNSTKMFSWIQAWHQAKRKSNQEALRRGCRSTLSLLCCFNWLRYLQLSNITILDLYWLNIEIKDQDKLQTARDVHVIIFSRLFTLAAYIFRFQTIFRCQTKVITVFYIVVGYIGNRTFISAICCLLQR